MRRPALLVAAVVLWAAALPAHGEAPGKAMAAGRALGLPLAILARIGAYEAIWADASRNPTDAAACQLITEARQLEPALFRWLNPRVDRATPAQREVLAKQLAALDASLPGLVTRDPREKQVAFAIGWDYVQLGEALAFGPASRALLTAAGEVIGRHGQAGHVFDLGNEDGCTDYGRALGPFARLAVAWKQGPPCLKEALRPPLKDTLAWLGDEVNFCYDEAKARADVGEAVRLLNGLGELGGPAAAKRLAQNMREGDLTFGNLAGEPLEDP